jgi:PBP1b-binding outer membrane lipoprotein LpoB
MFLGDDKMIRKSTILIVILALAFTMVGCRKKPAPASPPPSTPPKTEVKTQAQYEAQAKRDINSTNMQAELEKIEKDVQKESGGAF